MYNYQKTYTHSPTHARARTRTRARARARARTHVHAHMCVSMKTADVHNIARPRNLCKFVQRCGGLLQLLLLLAQESALENLRLLTSFATWCGNHIDAPSSCSQPDATNPGLKLLPGTCSADSGAGTSGLPCFQGAHSVKAALWPYQLCLWPTQLLASLLLRLLSEIAGLLRWLAREAPKTGALPCPVLSCGK